MSDLVAEIKKIPPVTRFLCLASLGVSVPVMAKIISPYSILFVREAVTRRLELWRIPTSFFLGSEFNALTLQPESQISCQVAD
jgi:Derlin-2/3